MTKTSPTHSAHTTAAGTGGVRRLELDGEVTINTAAQQYQTLMAFVTSPGSLEVGLAAVSDLDTAGLQLLLLARQEAERLGATLSFREPSQAVQDILTIAHLNGNLDNVRPGLEGAD